MPAESATVNYMPTANVQIASGSSMRNAMLSLT
jgi:hypothetical protein